MTVRELIEELSKYDGDLEVIREMDDRETEVVSIDTVALYEDPYDGDAVLIW